MKKSQTLSLILLTSSALLASNAFAQTSPTSGSTQTPAAKPPASSGAMKKKQEAALAAVAAVNLKDGQTFLAANKAKPGVVALTSGLQYKIVTAGTGAKPTAEDTVLCNYRGTLLNGTEFDNSAKHGGPTEIPVGGVIKGWTEALQLMPAGSKWQLYVPAELAYGPRQAGPDIGPNSTLIFQV